jgi:hypothetical protein
LADPISRFVGGCIKIIISITL